MLGDATVNALNERGVDEKPRCRSLLRTRSRLSPHSRLEIQTRRDY